MKINMKIQMFTAFDPDELQREVNDWIAKQGVAIEIEGVPQFSTSSETDPDDHSCLTTITRHSLVIYYR